MRTAVCISGMSRTFKKTYASQQANLLAPHRADVFASTWKPTFADDMWPDADSPEEMIELYQPLKFDIELYNEARKASFETNNFHTNSDWNGRSVSRMIPMFYKIYLANMHRHMYQKENAFSYDIVVRCRSDLKFHAPVELKRPEPNTVYFPEKNSQNGVNDQFWYCDSETSNKLADLYINIPELWHAGVIIHGELLLYAFTEVIGVKKELVDVSYEILRS